MFESVGSRRKILSHTQVAHNNLIVPLKGVQSIPTPSVISHIQTEPTCCSTPPLALAAPD